MFGETKIPAPPTRVVSAGFTEQDDLLAVGVVPIAVTDWFGGEPFGVWPWAQPKLGAAQPVVLSLADGIQVDQIAALKPDLIVATNAGLDQDTYTKLTAIAPTIAQSGQDAFFEPWKDQATTIGQAVFKADEMQALIAGVDDKFATAGKNNPQFADKKVLLLQGTFCQDSVRSPPRRLAHRLPHPDGFVIPTASRLRPRRPPRLHSRKEMGRPRHRRCADLEHRERRGKGRAGGRPDVQRLKATANEAQRLHRQGTGRGHRVRLAAVLPGGGRPAAATSGAGAGLTASARRVTVRLSYADTPMPA